MKTYMPWNPSEQYLLPPSPDEWLPESHLVYFLLEVVGELDLTAIEAVFQGKDARGTRPYSPAMMVALLLYGYCVGVYSSRRLERASYEDVAFRVLCAGHHPDHTRISEFRRVHLEALKGLFLQVLKLCQRAGLVKLGHVALDGTKIQGNASKHKAMSYQRMVEVEKRLQQEIAGLMEKAEATDTAEDERLGKGVRGDELPEELRRRETRLARIRQAKAELEEEAKLARAQALREKAEQERSQADAHSDASERKRAATRAKNKEEKARQLTDGDDQDPPSFVTPEGLPKHRVQTETDGTPTPMAQRNFTDPESRIMESGGGFLQGYNSQVAADSAHQIIVAQAVTNQGPDNWNLVPMLDAIISNCGSAPEILSADAGYWAPGVAAEAAARGTDAYVATERHKHWETHDTVTEGPPPSDSNDLEKMRHKLRTKEGRERYARRKAIVEPVHGQQKEARRFRRYLLRGLRKVAGEFALLCTGHNLLKLFRATQRSALVLG